MGPLPPQAPSLLQHSTVCIETIPGLAAVVNWIRRKGHTHRLSDAMRDPVGSVEAVKDPPVSVVASRLDIYQEPRGEQPLLSIEAHPDDYLLAVAPWFSHHRGALTRNTRFVVWDSKPRKTVGELKMTRSWLTGVQKYDIFDEGGKHIGDIVRDNCRVPFSWWSGRPMEAVIHNMPFARIEEAAGAFGLRSMRIDFARNAVCNNARKLCLAAAIMLHRNQLVRTGGYT